MIVRIVLAAVCLLLAGCQVAVHPGGATSAELANTHAPRDLRRAIAQVDGEAAPTTRMRRDAGAWRREPGAEAAPSPFLATAAPARPRRLVEDLVLTQDTNVGRGFVVPSSRSRGMFGTQLRGSLSFRAPDVWEAGLFYTFGSRWTVGVIGQRLVQERTVSVDGQLVDPTDLSSFISGFTVSEDVTALSFGPYVQFQILAEGGGWRPEISVAALALELGTITDASTSYSMPSLIIDRESSELSSGDEADKYRSVFFAASKQIPGLRGGGFFRGVRAYGGAGYAARTGSRYATAITGQGDPRIKLERKDITRHSFVGWIGGEIQLPAGFSGFGEWFTGDECEAGYAFGLRWTSPFGVVFTFAFNECYASVPQRALDLVYKPGGVGGQPSVVSGGTGLASGGVGFQYPEQDDRGRGRGRGRR